MASDNTKPDAVLLNDAHKYKLGANLRDFRKSQNLSREAFGEKYGGYTVKSIYRYEQGMTPVPTILILNVLRSGQCPLYVLFHGIGETKPTEAAIAWLITHATQALERIEGKAQKLLAQVKEEHQQLSFSAPNFSRSNSKERAEMRIAPIGRKIRAARLDRKISQKKLSEMLRHYGMGIFPANLCRIEQGEDHPNWTMVATTARLLNMDIADLVSYDEPKKRK